MRILGFSKRWDKLQQPEFTTFRFPRKDKDWAAGVKVQVVYKPRRKGGGEKLGIARIVGREQRWVMRSGYDVLKITQAEAKADGFADIGEMVNWISHAHQARNFKEPMNKLTLRWINEKD